MNKLFKIRVLILLLFLVVAGCHSKEKDQAKLVALDAGYDVENIKQYDTDVYGIWRDIHGDTLSEALETICPHYHLLGDECLIDDQGLYKISHVKVYTKINMHFETYCETTIQLFGIDNKIVASNNFACNQLASWYDIPAGSYVDSALKFIKLTK